MAAISQVSAREILDSRGRPTVEATCVLSGGATGIASVPSGRSTGKSEAVELRDGDPRRYRGLGCLRATANVNGEMAAALVGSELTDQAALDRRLIELDGTPNKARLGANAILAVSVAFARAQAAAGRLPLYRHFASIAGQSLLAEASRPPQLPRLTINLFSGGKHAGAQVSVQDVLIVPLSPQTIDGSLVMMYNIYQTAAEMTLERYGMRLLTADEGGLAPPFPDTTTMIENAVEAIERAGYRAGIDASLAIDVAASHFYEGGGAEAGRYHVDGRSLAPEEMIDLIVSWIERYPIVSVEDGLDEEDWAHWPLLERAVDRRALVLGDDLLCTNPARIRRAAAADACDSLLLKVNQIGTLTEAAAALRLARAARFQVSISVRSGETEDNWAADLAVGFQADQFKNGSITQSERLAKYNRLLAIEQECGWRVRPWRA